MNLFKRDTAEPPLNDVLGGGVKCTRTCTPTPPYTHPGRRTIGSRKSPDVQDDRGQMRKMGLGGGGGEGEGGGGGACLEGGGGGDCLPLFKRQRVLCAD